MLMFDSQGCSSIPRFRLNREFGAEDATRTFRSTLLDKRIDSLEASWRHNIPFRATNAIASTAMDFDNAESRFLLCGTARGSVFVVDFKDEHSPFPIRHKIIPSRRKNHHSYMITCCQWYPIDSSLFATSSRDKLIKLWDSNSMVSVDSFNFETPISQFHWTVGLSNSGSSLIAVAIGSSNVNLIDPRVGAAIHHVRCTGDRIGAVNWMKNSNFVLATGGNFGSVYFWDIRSGRTNLGEICLSTGKKSTDNEICYAQSTDDGQFFITQTKCGRIQVFDADTLHQLSTSKVPAGSSTGRFACTSEGRSLFCFALTGNEIFVNRFNFSSPSLRNEPDAKKNSVKILRGHFQPVTSCAYRSGYQQLVTSANDRLTLVWAPKMDETRQDAEETTQQQYFEDAFSDDE